MWWYVGWWTFLLWLLSCWSLRFVELLASRKSSFEIFAVTKGLNKSKNILKAIENVLGLGWGKKLFVSIWPGVKKNFSGEIAKIFLFIFFCNIVVLFYSFFYLDSIHCVYLKWFFSIETSSWYIFSIFKTRDNVFQCILIRKFINIKDAWTKYRHSYDLITLKCPECI